MICTHNGIDLADTALTDDHICTIQTAGKELHSGALRHFQPGQFRLQGLHFQFHGADDSDFFHTNYS